MLQIASEVGSPHGGRREAKCYPGFQGGICRNTIQYRHRWHRDLLIQAALDPAIDVMERSQAQVLDYFAFEVGKTGRRLLVVGVHDAATRPELESDLDIVFVTKSTVLNEPILSAARAIWATRHNPIAAGDRIRILTALERAETQSLNELASVVREPADGVEAILGMICSGELATSAHSGIRPEMKVWRRRPIELDALSGEARTPNRFFGCPQEAGKS